MTKNPDIIFSAVKFRIYPDKDQEDWFIKSIGASRLIYNKCVAYGKFQFEQTGRHPSAFDVMKQITILKKKEGFSWLAEMDSQSLRSPVINWAAAISSFKKATKGKGTFVGYPSFKKKGVGKESFSIFQYQAVCVEEKRLKLSKAGWVKARGSWSRMTSTARKITVCREAGKWYASCLIEAESPEPHIHKYQAVGIDVGVAKPLTLAVQTYEGDIHYKVLGEEEKQALLRKETHRKWYQRQLARKVKGSKNQDKAKLKVQLSYKLEADYRKNFVEQVSYQLSTKCEIVKFESLKIQSMTRTVCKNEDGSPRKGVAAKAATNREMLRMGFGRLFVRTQEKSKLLQGEVQYVNAKHTSQRCSDCGHIEKTNRRSQSKFQCVSCGFRLNADMNAARNILFRTVA